MTTGIDRPHRDQESQTPECHNDQSSEQNQSTLKAIRENIAVFNQVVTDMLQAVNPGSARSGWKWGFREKTALDLMQIFAGISASVLIPIAVNALSMQQARTAEDNQRQEVLSKYYDQMSTLLLNHGLDQLAEKQSEQATEQNVDQSADSNHSLKANRVLSMARARTLSTFRQLEGDGERRGQLLKFLYEAKLIGGECKVDDKTLESQGCQNSLLPLKGARLEGLTFDSTILLTGVNLEDAFLDKAVLPGIDLTRANMTKAKLKAANLSGALLKAAQMETANLQDANLSKSFLPEAHLNFANLKGANLAGANLRNVNLQGANLQDANLENANLENADLRGTNLTGASLKGAKMSGAIYNVDNQETKFPAGFSQTEDMTLRS